MKNQNSVSGTATQKVVKVHSIVILCVCILLGILSFFTGSKPIGITCIVMGILIPIISLLVMRKAAINSKGIFLNLATVVVVTVLAGGSSTLYTMVTILLANIGIACIYYDPKNIRATWALTDVVLIVSAFFPEQIYGAGLNMLTILKGIIGVNIGGFMIHLLMKNSLALIAQAREETARGDDLLAQVQVKMAESEALTAKQADIMRNVAAAAVTLESTSTSMLDISSHLTAASEEQAGTIADIHTNVEHFANETDECYAAAIKATEAAVQSVEMLQANSETLDHMVHAMRDLEETSSRISGIIKTIDDISFQTNILALNAAVEAARAGAAGKGFAVVADEVRNLAGKSAEAAKITEDLINESIRGVRSTTQYVLDTADHMAAIIERSRLSEVYARQINELTAQQKEDIREITASIAAVSEIVATNTQTALESAGIARSLSDEVEHMNRIVAGR